MAEYTHTCEYCRDSFSSARLHDPFCCDDHRLLRDASFSQPFAWSLPPTLTRSQAGRRDEIKDQVIDAIERRRQARKMTVAEAWARLGDEPTIYSSQQLDESPWLRGSK
jgi:hypothetical protein